MGLLQIFGTGDFPMINDFTAFPPIISQINITKTKHKK